MSQRSAGSCTRCTRSNAFPVASDVISVLVIVFLKFDWCIKQRDLLNSGIQICRNLWNIRSIRKDFYSTSRQDSANVKEHHFVLSKTNDKPTNSNKRSCNHNNFFSTEPTGQNTSKRWANNSSHPQNWDKNWTFIIIKSYFSIYLIFPIYI